MECSFCLYSYVILGLWIMQSFFCYRSLSENSVKNVASRAQAPLSSSCAMMIFLGVFFTIDMGERWTIIHRPSRFFGGVHHSHFSI